MRLTKDPHRVSTSTSLCTHDALASSEGGGTKRKDTPGLERIDNGNLPCPEHEQLVRSSELIRPLFILLDELQRTASPVIAGGRARKARASVG